MTTAARLPRLHLLGFAIAGLLAAMALMVTPSAEAGLIGTDPASSCSTSSKVFTPWGGGAKVMAGMSQ